MKRIVRLSLTSLALASGLTMVNSTRADTPITTFDNFVPNALYPSWSAGTAIATPTNYIITATGYGSLWKQLGPPPINGAGNSNIVVDVNLSGSAGADGKLGVIVDLKDADNTQISYRWYGRSTGHHILVGNLFSTNVPATDNGVIITNNLYRIVTNAAGTTAGLDLTALWHLNLELDPSTYAVAYTLQWNDLRLTSGSGGSTGVCAVVSAFDNTVLSGLYGSWTAQTPTPTNLQVTATGWGGGWSAVTPNINTTSNKTLQLNVTLTAPAAANGKLGPIVVLEDGDGTQLKYAWYGQTPGTNLVLSSVLSGGTIAVAGSVAGFDFSTIKYYNLQLDPSSYAGSYTVAWNDLSIIGCDNTNSETGFCATVCSFKNFFMSGDYGNWLSANEISTPDYWEMSASGFGGGYSSLYPNLTTTSNRTLQLNVTLIAPAAANGKLGPIVVLQDADGTQLNYAWYGQSPGTNLVLTKALNAGAPVGGQPGTTAGFDFSSIAFFHLQLDSGSYADAYTIQANDLSIIGCPPVIIQITAFSYDPVSGQFNLTWSSENGATYAIQTSSDLGTTFADAYTGIASGGASTSVSITPLDPARTFIRIRKE